jgi:hypothetical protein
VTHLGHVPSPLADGDFDLSPGVSDTDRMQPTGGVPVKDYCLLQSVPYNERGSDDWIKSNSALPGGLLKSKPTWPNAFGCSATSAFFVLGDKGRS